MAMEATADEHADVSAFEELLAELPAELLDVAAAALERQNHATAMKPGFKGKLADLKHICYCCRKLVPRDHVLRNCPGSCPKCGAKPVNGVLVHTKMQDGKPCIYQRNQAS